MKEIHDSTVDVKRAAADNAEDFASWIFPAGKRVGGQWHVGDLSGAPGDSLTVELRGEHASRWKDWAADESGDCIALLMAVHGTDFVSAKRLLGERYGITMPLGGPTPTARPAPIPRREPPKTMAAPKLPTMESGSREDVRRLSELRNLSPAALDLAIERGLLWFYDSSEGRAWLITDSARRNAQARRLDGQPWEWNSKKAWTLGGSQASWPIGLPESEPFPAIALCEGGPDFLAAFHHALASNAENVAPVCIIGASLSIPAECLPSFARKRVRIFVHADAEGMRAAQKWAGQLRGVGAEVDGFNFDGLTRSDGEPVSDLCDLASIDPDSWERERDAVENCMNFVAERRVA